MRLLNTNHLSWFKYILPGLWTQGVGFQIGKDLYKIVEDARRILKGISFQKQCGTARTCSCCTFADRWDRYRRGGGVFQEGIHYLGRLVVKFYQFRAISCLVYRGWDVVSQKVKLNHYSIWHKNTCLGYSIQFFDGRRALTPLPPLCPSLPLTCVSHALSESSVILC